MSKKHIGSNLNDFLAEEALLDEATATAVNRVNTWQQIEQEIGAQKPTKAIPKFENEAEERTFWESHDSTAYVDWSEAKRAIKVRTADEAVERPREARDCDPPPMPE